MKTRIQHLNLTSRTFKKTVYTALFILGIICSVNPATAQCGPSNYSDNKILSGLDFLGGGGSESNLQAGSVLLAKSAFTTNGVSYDVVIKITSVSINDGKLDLSSNGNIELNEVKASQNPSVNYTLTIVQRGSATSSNLTGTPVTLNGVWITISDLDGLDSSPDNFGDVGGFKTAPNNIRVGNRLTNSGFTGSVPANASGYNLYRPSSLSNSDDADPVDSIYAVQGYYNSFSTGSFLFGSTGTNPSTYTRGQALFIRVQQSCNPATQCVLSSYSGNKLLNGLSFLGGGGSATNLIAGSVLLADNALIANGTTYDVVVRITKVDISTGKLDLSDNGNIELKDVKGSDKPYTTYTVSIVTNGSATSSNLTGNPVVLPNIWISLGDIDGLDNTDDFADIGGYLNTISPAILRLGSKITTAGFDGSSPSGFPANYNLYRPSSYPNGSAVDANILDSNYSFQAFYNTYNNNSSFVFGATGSYSSTATRGQALFIRSEEGCITIRGTVFDDGDGSAVKNGTEVFTNAGGLYATLVNSENKVIASVPVNATTGAFSFSGYYSTDYKVVLTTNAQIPGATIPVASLPTNWVFTGTNIAGSNVSNTNKTGIISFTTPANNNPGSLNFGIEQRPFATGTTSPTQNNSASPVAYFVPATAFKGTDADGKVDFIRISSFPVNAQKITVNGVEYTSTTFPTGGITVPTNVDGSGNPTQLISVTPNASSTLTIDIPFYTIDNANVESTNPAHVLVPYVLSPSSIGNLVFNDANNNGIQDAGEAGIAGVTVSLTNPNGTVTTAVTDANGNYSFANLAPTTGTQTYTIGFTTPAGYIAATPNLGGNDETDSDPVGGSVTGITLTAGQVNNSIDAGFYQANLNLGNTVWNDQNNDGVKQSTETGISGVAVKLYLDANNDNVADGASIATATTDANGVYNFGGLSPNNYIVGVTIPTGYAVVTTNGGDADNNIDNDNNGTNTSAAGEVRSNAVTLTTGGEPATGVDGDGTNGNLTVDFALVSNGSIGDFVWNDANGNGVQDVNELGLPNVTVRLTYPDNTTIDALTNAAGGYLFAGLAAGTYSVTFITPAGYAPTLANAGGDDAKDSDPVLGVVSGIALGAGQNNATIDAGFYMLMNVGNNVWYDKNNNGIKDAGELGIGAAPVKLYVDANNDNVADGGPIATTTTDANGVYNFANLTQNNYIVGVTIPSGYSVVTNNGGAPDNNVDNDNNGVNTSIAGEVRSLTFNISPGAEPMTDTDGDSTQGNLTIDFGFTGAGAIGNFVWNDLNRNGLQDANEPGLAGVIVTLTNPDATTVVTTTDANGAYNFPNLLAGTYSVAFTTPATYLVSPNNVGTNDLIDSDPVSGVVNNIVLGVGDINNSVDAGFYAILSLRGNVWHDVNGMNDNLVNNTGPLQTPVASQIPIGIRVVRVDPNTGLVLGNALVSAETGAYSFNNVNPGNYILLLSTTPGIIGQLPPFVTLPSGWLSTGEKLGLTPGRDPLVDGTLSVRVTTANVINANFGILLNLNGDVGIN